MLVTLHNKSVHTEWIQPQPAMIYTESPSGDFQAVGHTSPNFIDEEN
jgi:hypothetical protein